jgi:hypothetical protein
MLVYCREPGELGYKIEITGQREEIRLSLEINGQHHIISGSSLFIGA